MVNTVRIGIVLGFSVLMTACADKDRPNYQYMPNMYEAVGYEAYSEVGFLPEGQSALVPPDNTVARGKIPYTIENSPEGKEMARMLESPLDSLRMEDNLTVGKELYGLYCAICHGPKGDGQGNLVKREKILGVPSYADQARNITVGTTYHVIYHGLNSMGSYAGQLNEKERWQVAEYVIKLKHDLSK